MTVPTGGNGLTPTSPSATGLTPTQGTPHTGNGLTPPGNTEQYSPPSAEDWRKFQAEFAEAKRENHAYRKARDEAEAAKLSDLEKANKRLEEADKKAEAYRAKVAALAVQVEAQKLGIIDPEVAATLVAAKLEFDADGAPTNAETLLKELVKAKPYLLGQPTQTQQQGGQPAQQRVVTAPTNPGRGAQPPQGGGHAPTPPGQMARFGTGKRLFTTGNGGG